MRHRLACAFLPLLFAAGLLVDAVLLVDAAAAQPIHQSRGVDARVDYASLTRYGPWDDRNYALTAEDLALLSPDEAAQSEAIPAFYRVELRRRGDLPTRGPVQYPRSGLPRFLLRYGGFLIDGKIYRDLHRAEDGRFVVRTEKGGIPVEDFPAVVKALSGEARVTTPNGAAESAVAFHPLDTNVVIAGTNGPGSGQKMHFSTDGGETWAPSTALPLGGTCCDPTVAWSSDGTKAYAATLGGTSGVWFYRSADGGQSWSDLATEAGADPRREVSTSASADKEYLHVDLHPSSPHLDNLYLTWHQANVLRCARSTDQGHTWSTVVFSGDPSGIGSDVATDAAGNVYVFWPAFGTQEIVVKKSTDGGATFGAGVTTVAATEGSFIFPIPSMEAREVFIYNSADSDRTGGPFDDSLYVAWTDSTGPTSTAINNHARIQVAYSRDGGDTWTVTTPHQTADATTVDRYHQWLAVGPDGTVHVIFYDTRRDLPSRNQVDVFHSFSTDGAQTWSAPTRLTAAQSPNIADGFEFGDYNGLDVVIDDLIAVFTDNRSETLGGGDSVDVYVAGATVGVQEIFSDGFESGDVSGWSDVVP